MAKRTRTFGTITERIAAKAKDRNRKPARSYLARYTAPNLTKPARTFATKDAASAWLDAERELVDAGAWTPPAARKAAAEAAERRAAASTIGAYAHVYLRERTLRPSTLTEYRRLLRTTLAPLLERRIDSLTRTELREWWDHLDPTSPSVNAAAYRLLRAILKAAEDDELIDRAPTLPGAGAATRVHKPVPATILELQTITDAMPGRLRLFVVLAAWVGPREGELLELRRSDLLRDGSGRLTGDLHISRAVSKDVHPDAPGACDCGRVVGPTKTAAGDRIVVIPAPFMPLVREHLLEHAASGDDGLLFPGVRSDHMSARYLRDQFNAAKTLAGRPDLRIHDLRHTALTLAGQVQATAAELKHRAGHSSSAAMSIYQHGTRERDAEIARRLGELYVARRREL